MRVVSENTESEIAAYEAEQRLDASLRTLAANMLRVVRGAGRAYEFGGQMADVLRAMQAYRDAAGVWPSDQQLSSALRLREPDYLETLPEHGQDRFYAERSIVRGALQIAASELLGQQTQKAAGRDELHRGRQAFERALEATRTAPVRAFSERLPLRPKRPKGKPPKKR